MMQLQKLINKLHNKPKDFTWAELQKLMKQFGYKEYNKGKTSGSRVIFVGKKYQLLLHKPHPIPNLKSYQIKAVIEFLQNEGSI